MRLPPLNALKAFEAASRLMSFQKAADELHVTPSALSYQIKNLEDKLGVTLFERNIRQVSLTPEGELIKPGIAGAFEQMQAAINLLQADTPDHVVVVSCAPAHAVKWLAPRLSSFGDAHPDLELRISASTKLADFSKDGVDVAIRFGSGHYPGLHVEPIFEEYLTPMIAPDLLAKGMPLNSPDDLQHYQLLHEDPLMPTKQYGWQDWLKEAGASSVDASKGIQFSHADFCLEAAVKGVGVALGRVELAAEDIREGRLVTPFDLKIRTGLITSFVCPPSHLSKEKTIKFRDWLFAELEGLCETNSTK